MKRLFALVAALAAATFCWNACQPKSNPEIAVTGVSLSETSLTLNVGGSVKLTATITPENATDASLTWSSSKPEVASVQEGTVLAIAPGTAIISATTKGGVNGSCTVTVKDGDNPGPDGPGPDGPGGINANGHTAIDLGLSVLWASCNVGAENFWEAGSFFAWGETEDAFQTGNIGFALYKWGNGADNYYDFKVTKYCTDGNYGKVDNLTRLLPEDDAAHVNMGGDWRMPTAEECKELYDNCNLRYSTYGGYEYMEFTSIHNGYSIRIPLGGYYGSNYDEFDPDHYWYSENGYSFTLYTANLYEDDSRRCWYFDPSIGDISRTCLANVRGVLPRE